MNTSNQSLHHQKKSNERKLSGRLWWITLHIGDYILLYFKGYFDTTITSISYSLFLGCFAICNAILYITLQRSSPGYIPYKYTTSSQHIQLSNTDIKNTIEKTSQSSINDPSIEINEFDTNDEINISINDNKEEMNGLIKDIEDKIALHYCDICDIQQPLRSKHCKYCNRCVQQYDHHCDCAGTCIGEKNRRLFLLYLLSQSIESILMVDVNATAMQLSTKYLDGTYADIIEYLTIIAYILILLSLFISIPLFCYQCFLITTNQTSWEHSRRGYITYLQHLKDENSPFDKGCFRNWINFIRHHNTNVWVHDQLPPTKHQSTKIVEDETDIM